MRSLGTKRHTLTTIKSVLKRSNEENTRPLRNQEGSWRIRTNEERELLIKHSDIVKYTKAQRIRWIGHIVRLDKERTVKITREWRSIVVMRIGRLRLRWKVDVRKYLGIVKIQNWSKMAMNRNVWKRNC